MNNPATPEETPSPAFEKAPPKLNLPPKPILASAALPSVTETSSSLPVQVPPTIPMDDTSFPLLSSTAESASTPEIAITEAKGNNSSKKKFCIGLPLAFLTILIALLAFLMQLRLLF